MPRPLRWVRVTREGYRLAGRPVPVGRLLRFTDGQVRDSRRIAPPFVVPIPPSAARRLLAQGAREG